MGDPGRLRGSRQRLYSTRANSGSNSTEDSEDNIWETAATTRVELRAMTVHWIRRVQLVNTGSSRWMRAWCPARGVSRIPQAYAITPTPPSAEAKMKRIRISKGSMPKREPIARQNPGVKPSAGRSRWASCGCSAPRSTSSFMFPSLTPETVSGHQDFP